MEIQNAKSLAAFLKKRRKYLEKKKTILINLSDIKVKTFPKKAIDLPSSFMGFARQIKHQIRSCLLSREVFTENYPVDSHVIKFYEYCHDPCHLNFVIIRSFMSESYKFRGRAIWLNKNVVECLQTSNLWLFILWGTLKVKCFIKNVFTKLETITS